MINVQVVTPDPVLSDDKLYAPRHHIEVTEKVDAYGSAMEKFLIRHELECAKMLFAKLSDIDCNVNVRCGITHGRFSADGTIELWNSAYKPIVEDAVRQVMQIGAQAKHCNGSKFKLEVRQRVSLVPIA